MSEFCAICVSERGPFKSAPLGKGDAMVRVCADCESPIIEGHGVERGYEPTGGIPTAREMEAGMCRVLGNLRDSEMEKSRQIRFRDTGRSVPPGWSVYLVKWARGLDAQNAYKLLYKQPWFGPGRVKYCGSANGYLVFGYAPTVKLAIEGLDPFAAIERYRVKR